MAKTWTIYLLRDGGIGYVGQTIRTAENRLKVHLAEARRGGALKAVHRWLAGLDHDPRLVVLQRCDSLEDANTAERDWMRWARKGFGLVLMNRRMGGQHGYDGAVHGEAISRAVRSPEHRATSVANAIRAQTFVDRVKWREAIHSPESRRKKSDAMKRKWAEPGYAARVGAAIAKSASVPGARERAAAARREINARPEVKAAVDAARIALWKDPVNRARRCAAISKALTGKTDTRTEVTKAPQRQKMKALWADPEWKAAIIAKRARVRLARSTQRAEVAYG